MGSTNSASLAAAVTQLAIPAAMDDQTHRLAALHQALSHLEDRLSPVLEARGPEEVNKEPEARAGLSGSIEVSNRGITHATARIEKLIGRLEI